LEAPAPHGAEVHDAVIVRRSFSAHDPFGERSSRGAEVDAVRSQNRQGKYSDEYIQ